MDTSLKTLNIDLTGIYEQFELATRNMRLITTELAKRMREFGEYVSVIMKSVYEKLAELSAILIAQLAYSINEYTLENSITVNDSGYLDVEVKNVTRTTKLRNYCYDFFGQVFKAYPQVKPIVNSTLTGLSLVSSLIAIHSVMAPDPKPVINNYYEIDEIHYHNHIYNKNKEENMIFLEDKDLSGGIKS